MSVGSRSSGRGVDRRARALLAALVLAACDDGPAAGDAAAGAAVDAGADAAATDGGRRLDSGTPAPGGGGGSGGSGGHGGRVSCTEPRAICGNGLIDGPTFAGTCGLVEQCDGDDRPDASCETMGYGPGELRCTDCSLDTSGCAVCPPLDEQLVACEVDETAARGPLALAAKPGAIALAWSLGPSVTPHFQRLTAELEPLGEPVAIEGAQGTGALLATDGGWLLALRSERLVVLALDDEGRVQRELLVADPGSYVPNAMWVSHPGSNPLLLWSVDGRLDGAVIAADGSARADVRNLPDAEGSFAAAFIEDGFLIATRLALALEHPPVTIRVSEDGEAAAPVPSPHDAQPAFAPTGRGTLALVYADASSDVPFDAWAELDARGTLVSGPEKLDAQGTYLGSSPTLLPMDGGFALISSLGYVPLDEAGVPLAMPKTLFVVPFVHHLHAVRSGDEIVVAWASPVGLARLRP